MVSRKIWLLACLAAFVVGICADQQPVQSSLQDPVALLQVKTSIVHRSPSSANASALTWWSDSEMSIYRYRPNQPPPSDDDGCQGAAKELQAGSSDGTSFRCSGGLCIKLASRCDGQTDCADGSDEFACESRTSLEEVEKQNVRLAEEVTRLRIVSFGNATELEGLKAQLSTLNASLTAKLISLNASLTPSPELQSGVALLNNQVVEEQDHLDDAQARIQAQREATVRGGSTDLEATITGIHESNSKLQDDINAIKTEYGKMKVEPDLNRNLGVLDAILQHPASESK